MKIFHFDCEARELKEYQMSIKKTEGKIGTHSALLAEILINDQESVVA